MFSAFLLLTEILTAFRSFINSAEASFFAYFNTVSGNCLTRTFPDDFCIKEAIEFFMPANYRFSDYIPPENTGPDFESLLKIFLQLVTLTSGEVGEALSWMNELDKQYNLTNDDYGMGDFLEDLKRKGYISDDPGSGEFKIRLKANKTSGKVRWKRYSGS